MMTEGVLTSETSVYFNETTRRYIPEGYHLFPYNRKENVLKGKTESEAHSKVKQSLYTPWRRLGGEEV
jgi:hypothetical protein